MRSDDLRRRIESWQSQRMNSGEFPPLTWRVHRNDPDRAVAWLDRAFERHDKDLLDVAADPLLKNLRSDPRYKALLHRMKLPEP
jgi:hypothetical protein